MREGTRIVVPGTGQTGVITDKIAKADGPWAEQFYAVRLDDNDLSDETLPEWALREELEQTE